MKRLATLGIELARGALNRAKGMVPPVPLAAMTLDEDDAAIAKAWLMQDEGRWNDASLVNEFEQLFADWNGSHYAFAFSAGRKALSACIYALGLRRGDEVIIPGYTCVVVQNAFDFSGVRTTYCDIELDTFGPDLASIVASITPQTKAIFIQHLYGLVCRDYDAILALARRHGIKVIEDCAHATGARFRGRRIGSFSDVAFYSSEWTKVFTTILGGMAVTNDPKIADRLARFASRCASPAPKIIEQQLRTAILAFLRTKRFKQWWRLPWAHFKYGFEETVAMPQLEVEGDKPDDYLTRIAAPAAALGLSQVPKIDMYNGARRRNARVWDKWCDENGYRKPMILPDSEPTFLRYPVLVESIRKINTEWATRELGVSLGVWFKTNLHPSIRPVQNCPNADRAVAQCINFPCLNRDDSISDELV